MIILDSPAIMIKTEQDLFRMRERPQGHYRLAADLDLAGLDWQPVGTQEMPFSGRLDGCGHSISNVKLRAAAGMMGFFGVLTGEVRNLTLQHVSAELPQAGEIHVGTVAANCRGSIVGVRVNDSRIKGSCSQQGTVGGFAGKSSGLILNSAADVAINLQGSGAWVGGFAGLVDGGCMETSEYSGRFEVEGTESNIGMFAGSIQRCTLTACRFASPMNKINGVLFNNFAAREGAQVFFDGCIWRDNTNSDELLSTETMEVRSECERHMRRMGTHAWTPDRTLTFRCSCGGSIHSQVFEAGKTHYGMPYTHSLGSYERFLACFEPDGSLKPWLKADGYDGFDLYMGTDCSGAIYWAWSRVCDKIQFHRTLDMLPAAKDGTIAVGGYRYREGWRTDEIFADNGNEKMCECYAKMHKGDAFVNYLKNNGHCRLCVQNTVVFRNREGKIDPNNSYMITHEQGDGLYPEHNDMPTSWLIDWKYSFNQLIRDFYIPITNRALLDGASPKVQVSFEEGNGTIGNPGRIYSNYRIISTSVRILEKEAPVFEKTLFTAVRCWNVHTSSIYARETVRDVDLSEFEKYIDLIGIKQDKELYFEASILLSNGQEINACRFKLKN